MYLRLKSWSRASALLLFGLVAFPVQAQEQDQIALQIAEDAILNDYLGMNFQGAAKKLHEAIDLCNQGGCSPEALAKMYGDLAVVYIAGLQDREQGKEALKTALQLEPKLQLDADLVTEEVESVFREIKGAGAAPARPARATPVTPASTGPVPESGGMVHVAPVEQTVLTPLPLYVELTTNAKQVHVRYQSPTSRDWETVTMKKHDTGYGVLIDCKDVGTPGEFRYYIEAIADGKVVAYSGTQEAPHRTSITSEVQAIPLSLPGDPPPARCETQECVPGMVIPGCPMPEGEACEADSDCERGLVCSDEICSRRKAAEAPRPHWITLAFQQDFMLLPAEAGICSGGNEYSCFFGGGIEYTGIPDDGNGNEIAGGFQLGTQRAMLGYEYRLPFGVALGLRGGFAFGGGPEGQSGAFFPVHAEARVAYYLRRGKLEPFAALSGGMAQTASKITVSIVQSERLPIHEGSDTDEILEPTNVDAWRRAGNAFVALGVGGRFLVTDRLGVQLEGRATEAFPTAGTILSAQLGVSVAFGSAGDSKSGSGDDFDDEEMGPY